MLRRACSALLPPWMRPWRWSPVWEPLMPHNDFSSSLAGRGAEPAEAPFRSGVCCLWGGSAVCGLSSGLPAKTFLFFSFFFFLNCNFFQDSGRIREARGGWHAEDWGLAWLARCAKTCLSERRPLGMLDLCWELADVCSFFVRIPLPSFP